MIVKDVEKNKTYHHIAENIIIELRKSERINNILIATYKWMWFTLSVIVP
jgi:hypothetical protein